MRDLDPALLATMTDEEVARTLRIDVAVATETIAQNPSSTIEPPQRESGVEGGRRVLEGLGEQRGDRGIASGLEMDRTIGEGGMGIVRLATQRSLGRSVAVKTLRPNVKSDAATLRLLREAWVTGSLEHPNIVPVYDLGLDEDGSPIIVLKRIEGVEWAEVMCDAPSARDRFGAEDLLEHNLRILVQLCNAVALAHARGVLHRDLKPENVMIGSFGEVYLVDWGIAVSLKADPNGRLPLASDVNEMAGTPCYMAPEMLGTGKLTERTDVYLLGAILHEVLTGEPPHKGTFKQIVGSILLSNPTYGADVPRELAQIATKAMSRESAARYPSADELRQRIEWYLRHRGSLALVEEARRRLHEMRAALASGDSSDEMRERLYHLFAESRFAFRQAIGASDSNEGARAGLREAIETIVEFELERGSPEAASAALAELEDPPAELTKRVTDALRGREAERKRIAGLEQMRDDMDPAIGRRTRAGVSSMLGTAWVILPQFVGWLDRHYPERPHWWMYAWTVFCIALGGAVARWGRESLSKTALNRNMVALGMIMFATQLLLQMGGHLLGIPITPIAILHMLVWGAITAVFYVVVDRRFWVATVAYFAAFGVASVYPDRRWDLMSASTAVLLVTFIVAWWRPREDRPKWLVLREERLRAERDATRPTSVS